MTKAIFPVAFLLVGLFLMACGCRRPEVLQPPVTGRVPHTLEAHGQTRVDNYFWLKERENPEVVAYLQAENTYTNSVLEHTNALQETLFEEMTGRIKQDDESVPYFKRGYHYYHRFEEGKEYPIYCRRETSMDADEQIMLDVNQLAVGHEYFAAHGLEVSSDNNLLAFAEDAIGRRIYSLRFKDLTTGELLPDAIPEVTGNVAWANDNRTVFYTRQNLETLRPHLVYRHILGTSPADDAVIFDETDETFQCSIEKTKSERFLVIHSDSTLTNEARFIEADSPTDEFAVFLPRQRGHEYSIDHFGDRFYIRTNHEATNFRLMSTPVGDTDLAHWQEVIPHREDIYLAAFEIFRDHLVVSERENALIQLRIKPWTGEGEHSVDFGQDAYDAWIDNNPELNTTMLRFGFSSLTTPDSIFDYDMVTREKKLKKQEEILGGFVSANYIAKRLFATARNGVKVPISLVRRTDVEAGPIPVVLYAYGSYGYSMDADFRSDHLSLLDRGFAYAIAHVRGGQEYGRRWYEDGKLLKKKNTFTDFIDCAEFLIAEGYTTSDQLFAMGGSAGGLLMGAVVNNRPELFKGVVAQVPFVDVITTMMDPDIPLTTSEYDEWGNPNDRESYDYMLSYSPYDHVEAKAYPSMLVTAGFHDSQVQYWEPAKWVAKMRALKTDDHLLLLHTNMEAGHGGASGRFQRYRETALTYAFMLDQIKPE
ncbi:MAG: S9 family peptidase [Thermoanaerobaculales bacterium]|nr:S9 family peptidase [Thermoanaerobaculales bacterium]